MAKQTHFQLNMMYDFMRRAVSRVYCQKKNKKKHKQKHENKTMYKQKTCQDENNA